MRTSFFIPPPEFEGHYDPHVWGDIAAWSLCVEHIARALSAYDPEGAESYAANAKAYRQKLEKLAESAFRKKSAF
jgi:manganese/zinc/iron transport system substrate-binding protein